MLFIKHLCLDPGGYFLLPVSLVSPGCPAEDPGAERREANFSSPPS